MLLLDTTTLVHETKVKLFCLLQKRSIFLYDIGQVCRVKSDDRWIESKARSYENDRK